MNIFRHDLPKIPKKYALLNVGIGWVFGMGLTWKIFLQDEFVAIMFMILVWITSYSWFMALSIRDND